MVVDKEKLKLKEKVLAKAQEMLKEENENMERQRNSDEAGKALEGLGTIIRKMIRDEQKKNEVQAEVSIRSS